MKANEFVKKFGLDRAKQFVNADSTAHALVFATTGVSFIDLKRIVDAHELVVQCGGLEGAKSHLESIRFNIATKTWFGSALLNWSMYADKLVKAIADVESCMEGV